MAQEVYRIEIPIEVDDKTAQALQQAGMRITKFEKSVERTEKQLQKVSRTKWQLTLHALDRASHVIRRVGSTARTVAGGAYRVTVRVGDLATRPLRAIRGLLTSTLGLLGAGAGIVGGIIWPTKLADDLETARIGFETMLGSAQAATSFIAQIQQFAKDTPFGQQEVVELAKNLLVRGFGQNEIIPMLERIGNVTAAMGTGAEGIDRIIYALGQMRALGRVSAEDMNQLTDAGVRAWDYLAAGIGKSVAEVRKMSEQGLIAADDAIRHILEGMKEFDGMMQQTANRTLRGLWSQIMDVFEVNIFTRWGQGIQDAARPALSNIERWLSDNEDTIKRWGDTLQQTARDATQWVIDLFSGTFDYIRSRYLENPEFQQLDFQGKINFVFDDVMMIARNWYNREGKQQLKEIGGWLGNALADGLEGSAPRIAEAAIFLGQTLGGMLLNMVIETFKNSRIGAIILGALGGAAAGSVIPGVGTLTGAALGGLAAWSTHDIYKAVTQSSSKNRISDPFPMEPIAFARGGIVSNPQFATVAETGPEAIIPLTGYRSRAIGLWQETGRRLGASEAGGKTIQVNLNYGDIYINNDTDEDVFMNRMAAKIEEVLGNFAD